jgi:hypothetical protein
LAGVINAAFGPRRSRSPMCSPRRLETACLSIPGSFYPIARPIAPFLGASLAEGAGDIRSVLVIIGDDPHVSGMAGLVAVVRQDARCASAPDRFTAKGISFRCQQPSEIAMETVQPAVRETYREVAQSYRDLASRCRDMAKRDRRPASLLLRAAALEATAEYVERPGAQSA